MRGLHHKPNLEAAGTRPQTYFKWVKQAQIRVLACLEDPKIRPFVEKYWRRRDRDDRKRDFLKEIAKKNGGGGGS